MSKKLAFLLAIAFCFMAFSTEKKYAVELTVPEWEKHIGKLEAVRQIVDESNLPNLQVKFITKTIDSLERDIFSQVTPKVQTDIRIKDSLSKKAAPEKK